MLGMPELVETIEVVGKRGKCIRCRRPGRKRRVKARYGKHQSKVEDTLCIPCSKHVAIGVKWAARYSVKPNTYDSAIEVGMLSQGWHG